MYTNAVSFRFFIFSAFLFISRIVIGEEDIHHLTQDNFDAFVTSNPYVLVLFKSTHACPDCDEALEEVSHIEDPPAIGDAFKIAYVADDMVASKYGIDNHPALVFFRHGVPALFDGPNIKADDAALDEWLHLAVQEGIKVLTDDTFEHLTQAATGATTGDWFVVFYTPSCDTCMKIFPVVETVAVRKRVSMNFAKVDIEANKKLVDRFKIATHLKGILFRKGKMYEYEPGKFDAKSLTSFIDLWYKNVQAKPVPIEASAFDRLTGSIALNLKESFKDPSKKTIFLTIAVAIVIVCVAIVVKVFKKPSESRFKYDKNY